MTKPWEDAAFPLPVPRPEEMDAMDRAEEHGIERVLYWRTRREMQMYLDSGDAMHLDDAVRSLTVWREFVRLAPTPEDT